jgi:hypothetical protein
MVLKFSPDSLADPSQIHILAKTTLKMDAIEFVHKYESYLDAIQQVLKP